MRWARFEHEGRESFGIVEADRVAAVRGSPFSAWERSGATFDAAAVHWLPPVIPPTFYACGLNYPEHVRWAATTLWKVPPEKVYPKRPDVGYRAQSALVGHRSPIVIPADASDEVQYEAELAVVVGRRARHLTPADAMDCVFGYTILNDVSERVWQLSDRTLWRAKNADTFKPLGPWIETDADVDAMVTRGRRNGVLEVEFKTGAMIHTIVEYLVEITRYITLVPGDVIAMGSDGATPRMAAGDVLEIEITGVGTLVNPVLREAAPATTPGVA